MKPIHVVLCDFTVDRELDTQHTPGYIALAIMTSVKLPGAYQLLSCLLSIVNCSVSTVHTKFSGFIAT